MVASTYNSAMQRGVLPHEGLYSDDPRDPGGPTNFGITIYDARKYWKPSATAADVKTMPRSVAETIYASQYAAPLRYNDLPAGVDYAVLDYGINSGVARARRVLLALVAANDNAPYISNGIIALIKQRDPKKLIQALDDERLRFLRSLSTWDHFGKGWGRRVAEVNALALAFASGAANENLPQVTPTPNGETMAKGAHAKPKITRNIGTATGAVVAGGAAQELHSGGVLSFIAAHPAGASCILIGAVGAAIVISDLILDAHQRKQTTPMPGTIPVPVAA